MLVLKRKDGELVDIVHTSGDVLRIRVYNINSRFFPARVSLAFDDPDWNFVIQRPERKDQRRVEFTKTQ